MAPAGLLEDIIETMVYVEAKGMVDRADTPEAVKALPKSDLIALAQVIEHELAHAEIHGR